MSSSFANLMSSTGASPFSKLNLPFQSLFEKDPARRVAAEAAGLNPETFAGAWHSSLDPVRFLDALTKESSERMNRFVAGVRAYQNHPHRRALAPLPSVWNRGAATLRSAGGEGPAVLYVPSLVNRGYILDLAADRSLVRTSAAQGLGAYLLDWGDPSPTELGFTVTDYMQGVLIPALEEVAARAKGPVRLAGYCMGGTLAAAAAVLRPDLIDGLALLAAPWDFHIDSEAARTLMKAMDVPLSMMIRAEGQASVDLLQALFASLDPTLTGRKFRGFADLDPSSEEARRFIELEDWLNEGVPLAGPVMKEVLGAWYGSNDPARGAWRVSGTLIDPARITAPTLALIPGQDRIVLMQIGADGALADPLVVVGGLG
ncbi:MAG: alpha/beta hydrolase, partial [Proteobacteria bacterium]|nr:alpha/beta hydrolase [Pseudomonadota bacterium]